MDRLETVRARLAERAWRYPIIAGIASVPLTLVLQTRSVGTYVLLPVFVAGLLVGSLFRDRPTGNGRVGWRAGLVGGTALVWGAVRFSTQIPETASTTLAGVVFLVPLAAVTLFYILFYGVVGAAGGIVGGRLAERLGRTRVPVRSE